MFQDSAVSVVKRGDGSDDDGGAVPTVYAAHDPDDAEPDPAADPAAARSCCHCAIGTKGDPSPEVLLAARHASGPMTFAWPRLLRMRLSSRF